MNNKIDDVKFIADIGSNHNQDLMRAFKLIKEAKRIGCWGVKFQLFNPETLYASGYGPGIDELNKRALPTWWIPYLSYFCKENDIKFGCSPFYLDAVDLLNPYIDFLKISSFDIIRDDLITKCLKTKKPVIISLGLAKRKDIFHIFDLSRECNNYNVTMLHCVSKYPTRLKETNIGNLLETPANGYSDHSGRWEAISTAIYFGAKIVEFHFDLSDGDGMEFKHGHCWLPNYFLKCKEDGKVDVESLCNNIGYPTDEEILERADPEDGMRPMKEKRNGKSILL